MQACSGTEGCSKTRVFTSSKFRELKFTEHSKITMSLMKTSPLMLLREIIDDHIHNHMEHTELCENFFNVKCHVNIHSPLCFKGTVGYISSCNKTPTWFRRVQKTCDQPIPTSAATLLSPFQTVQVHYDKSLYTQKNFAISNPVTLLSNHAVLELNHGSPTF